MSDPHLQIQSLSFRMGMFAVEDINLSCARGEYHILLGPTGSGKSSLIKCLLGLHPAGGGRIFLHGRDITDEPPERRRMGYVPQDYALFPHLNVEENIRFGLRAGKRAAPDADSIVDSLCETLAIEGLRTRSVRGLSGGEQQRVALGRALASRPEIILLDEPFSAIDEGTRRDLWFELQRIIKKVGITALHITHNLDEAYTLGEKLSVLIGGRLAQSGGKLDIFERPASASVARYLNYRNVFSGAAEPHTAGTRIHLGHFSIVAGERIKEGAEVTLCVRQQDIKIVREGSDIREELRDNVFSGEVVSLFQLPQFCVMRFRIAGSPKEHDLELKFPAYIRQRHDLHAGKKVRVAIWSPGIIVFDAGSATPT